LIPRLEKLISGRSLMYSGASGDSLRGKLFGDHEMMLI